MPEVLHPGARLVTPYQQGELNSLCGLYALINAIRVVHAPKHPLPGSTSRNLFRAGAKALVSDERTRQALHQGMTAGQQYKLVRTLMQTPLLSRLPPMRLLEKRPKLSTTADLEHFIKKTVGRGDVLLVCFEGRLSHHTVVTGLTDQRLILCDSIGMRFIYARTVTPQLLQPSSSLMSQACRCRRAPAFDWR